MLKLIVALNVEVKSIETGLLSANASAENQFDGLNQIVSIHRINYKKNSESRFN